MPSQINQLMKHMMPIMGLREVVRPDGTRYIKDSGATPPGYFESLYPSDITTIINTLGHASMLLDLNHVDFTRGARQEDEYTKSIWHQDGRRITLSMSYSVVTASISNSPDPDRPEPLFDDRRKIANPPDFTVQKCLHPDCQIMVDRSKRKSGCCCKEHMHYECTHPDCVKKAALAGWPRATHPFGTKIADLHWQYKKEPQ